MKFVYFTHPRNGFLRFSLGAIENGCDLVLLVDGFSNRACNAFCFCFSRCNRANWKCTKREHTLKVRKIKYHCKQTNVTSFGVFHAFWSLVLFFDIVQLILNGWYDFWKEKHAQKIGRKRSKQLIVWQSFDVCAIVRIWVVLNLQLSFDLWAAHGTYTCIAAQYTHMGVYIWSKCTVSEIFDCSWNWLN